MQPFRYRGKVVGVAVYNQVLHREFKRAQKLDTDNCKKLLTRQHDNVLVCGTSTAMQITRTNRDLEMRESNGSCD